MKNAKEEINSCLLLYSGGLDTSCMLKWLQDKYNCDVITFTANLGQLKDWDALEKKALKLGVKKHFTIDLQEEFSNEYVAPAIKANALYEGEYPLATAIGRPLIAKKAVEIAEREGIDAIAHGCTGKGNDNVRITTSIHVLNPKIKVIAPVIEWGMSREESIEYAKKHGIPIPVTVESPYSIDENLWGRSMECGILEDPYVEPPEDAFAMTVSPEKAPDKPEYIEIEFEKGVPVSINGEEMKLVDLIKKVNQIAGAHGIGRIDHMEDRVVGLKSREVYEAPAAVTLIKAHKDLEKATSTIHELRFKEKVDQEWSYLAYAGLWFDPLREALESFINTVNEKVSGKVKLKLYKGGLRVVGRTSPYMLYDKNLATYEAGSEFNQEASIGFIELFELQSKLAHKIKKKLPK
ncbi:MAG: argininosuccinate synthase [Candidatus Odinarchaeia archaeon]